MAKIPLKIRMDLRDHWEKEDCPARKSIAALKDLLGLPVTIQLEPLILWSELQRFYSDQSTFVPCITTVIKAWLDCLTKRLADDANAAWTEQLLEHVNQSGRNLKARVETRPGTQVKTELAKTGATFTIGIPESLPPYKNVSACFMTEFEKLFTKSSKQTGSAQAQGAEDEDWADVTMPSKTRGQTTDILSTTMPSLDELPRPEMLFAAQTPYHLIVKVVHNGMVVQGSHQGSLELLTGYLQKYTRDIENISVKLPILKSELQASHFGYGALFDSLTITPGDPRAGWASINPILILSFIESVLGYSPVASGSTESQWYFKRDVGFKE